MTATLQGPSSPPHLHLPIGRDVSANLPGVFAQLGLVALSKHSPGLSGTLAPRFCVLGPLPEVLPFSPLPLTSREMLPPQDMARASLL